MFTNFKFILAIRFLGYLLFFLGLFGFFFILGPLVQAEANYRLDKIRGVKRTISNQIVVSQREDGEASANFADIRQKENSIVPKSTEYGIVIEKINANAKVVPGVNPADEKQYTEALTQGVAEALGSTKPGEPGNLYLFSHSVDAPWNIIRFNAIFYLLRELEKGDRVVIFYQNKRYDYIVFDKTVAEPNDVSFLTNRYDSPILTLQTCDPPGTLLKRLIIRAKLAST
ncbi:MAG: sortase [Candidatus Daviesbacteria bacterium]|nr:sortase [Candidatus Daviesbacteria bacterium]